MTFIIDRIEEGTAVLECEDGSHVNVSADKLPKGAREGKVLKLQNGVYTLDEAEEQKRREKIKSLEALLFGDED